MPTSNFPGGFGHGITIRNMPLLMAYPGEVFWVDDSGNDSGKGTFKRPFGSIDYANGRCTAGRGDIIAVKAGHAETVTAAITMDISDVCILGFGMGGSAPAITGNGAIDAVTMTAANCAIVNLGFPAPETDDQTADINIAAAGCSVLGTRHIGSQTAKNKTSFITITAAGHDFLLEELRTYNVTVEVTIGISIEGACARGEIAGGLISGEFTSGALADGATATELFIHGTTFKNTKADTVVVDFTNNSTGSCRDVFIDGRHTTIASNLVEGTGMSFYETYVVEEAAKNALLEPGVDAD